MGRRIYQDSRQLPIEVALIGSRAGGSGVGMECVLLWLRRRDGTAGAHGPKLPPVPLPGVWQAVQRTHRRRPLHLRRATAVLAILEAA